MAWSRCWFSMTYHPWSPCLSISILKDFLIVQAPLWTEFVKNQKTHASNTLMRLYYSAFIYDTGNWGRSSDSLCRSKYICISLSLVLGFVGNNSGIICSPLMLAMHCKPSISMSVTFFFAEQANVSSIDFDYLGYFFLRYNEYKRQKEKVFLMAESYLSKCSKWTILL